MKLSDIDLGKNKEIISCNASGLQNERLMALGFVPGNVVSVIKKGSNGKLSTFEVSKTLIALRLEESNLIEVKD